MLSLFAALATACSPPAVHKFPDTALFAGVKEEASFEAGKQLLETRIKERYRVGGPEGDIEAYLSAQGMKTRRKTGVGADGRSVYGLAEAFAGPGVCDKTVKVEWRASEAGTITEMNVVYGDTGCL